MTSVLEGVPKKKQKEAKLSDCDSDKEEGDEKNPNFANVIQVHCITPYVENQCNGLRAQKNRDHS